MQTCTGAICGLRRGVCEGFGPASIVISLTFGILKGEAPDAAASAGRFVSLAPDAFESENLLIAPNPCSVEGMGWRPQRYDTIRSHALLRMRLRIIYTCTCATETMTLVLVHIDSPRSLADQKH